MLDFGETGNFLIFGVAEIESDLKIWVAALLGALHLIFARNFGITRERWVVRLRDGSIVFPIKFYIWMPHFCENFGKVQILKNCIKGIFLDQFLEFLDF